MKVRVSYMSPLPAVFGATAITLYPFIFILIEKSQALDNHILHHEMVHVRQVRELGWARFYWRYLVEYLRHRFSGKGHFTAYYALSYEQAAYKQQEDLVFTDAEKIELGIA